ncbi:MAG: hypothetical protein HY728_07115, partial [Candidatus Rokubacteria bacterium]|nr:hypothetical protein [Candidatus Rokubacteria bacterium]
CMRGQQVDGETSAAACRATMGGRARPIPATLWHGADDVVVSPVNLDALAVMFSRLNAIVSSTTVPRSGAVHAEYRDTGGRLAVETWLIEGMSHAWSGGDPRATHTFPPGPSATERILDFLLGG